MTRKRSIQRPVTSGFSLIEVLIVLIVLMTLTASIFQMINTSTQRSSTEQTKLDMFQEAREFMDQMSRDLRQAGYPNPRNMDRAVLDQSPRRTDKDASAGLIKVDTGDLWLEADVDGTGEVSVIKYHLDTSTTNNCPCLKRSQLPKVNGDNLIEGAGGQTPASYQVEVQGVLNTDIFSIYNNAATIGLPVTILSGSGATIAGADTVQAILTLQAATVDPQTRKKPVTSLVTTVRVNNCSQAAIGFQTSCQ
jgi:prepilin-type N-terminal cleavage/methylation domain-containing protein